MDLNKIQNNIKLSQNENPFGPSPKAIDALMNLNMPSGVDLAIKMI